MSRLSERLRAIVVPSGALAKPSPAAVADAVGSADHVGSAFRRTVPVPDLEAALGGAWTEQQGIRCFVVERRYDAAQMYGRARVGDFATKIAECQADASLVTRGRTPTTPFVFFDLETTGLGGGAGTYAFLVGCGWFDGDDFLTRQFVMTRIADERAVLTTVATRLAEAGALVSFNGKSFDAPVLETRYLYHRLPWVGEGAAHVDVLHPARRFWPGDDCSLIALERKVLGAARSGDVPGAEIPERYFQFLRSGDARPLEAVLEHNRLDLLSLAGLTARLLHLIRSGPPHAADAQESHALGRTYERAGLDNRALEAYERAAAMAVSGPIRIDTQRSLAIAYRRLRRFDDAAGCWRAILGVRGCPRHIAREANEALAIHHEHRVRDLASARAFTLQLDPALHHGARHRLARIERKLGARDAPLIE